MFPVPKLRLDSLSWYMLPIPKLRLDSLLCSPSQISDWTVFHDSCSPSQSSDWTVFHVMCSPSQSSDWTVFHNSVNTRNYQSDQSSTCMHYYFITQYWRISSTAAWFIPIILAQGPSLSPQKFKSFCTVSLMWTVTKLWSLHAIFVAFVWTQLKPIIELSLCVVPVPVLRGITDH